MLLLLIIIIIIINDKINKFEKNMSTVTIKKPYDCGDKGPHEPLSPAASHCSCSSDLSGC